MTDVERMTLCIVASLDDSDPVLAMIALSRVLTGYIAAVSPSLEAAHEGLSAITKDAERALERKWPGVELLRTTPAGSA